MTYDFNGEKVEVKPGQSLIVVTSFEGDCASVLPDDKRIEKQIERGIWQGSFLYRVNSEGVKLLDQNR